MKRSYILRSITVAVTSIPLLLTSIGVLPISRALAQELPPATKAPESKPEQATDPEKPTGEDSVVQPEEEAPMPASDDEAIPSEEERLAAMTAFHAGESAFVAGNFSLALQNFRAAYDTIPSPHAEYWIALCLDKADSDSKEPATTHAAYKRFLSNPGADRVGEDQEAFARERVEELLKLMPASVTLVSNPSGATLVIDENPQEQVTPFTVDLAPGVHKIIFSREGFEDTVVELDLEGGRKLEQQVELNEVAQEVKPDAEPETDEPESMIPAYVTLGIAGAGLITGATFGILALTGKNKYNDAPTSAQADRVERDALIADMSLSVAVTLGITSYILFKNASKSRKEKLAAMKRREQFIVAPFATRTSGGAAARLKF